MTCILAIHLICLNLIHNMSYILAINLICLKRIHTMSYILAISMIFLKLIRTSKSAKGITISFPSTLYICLYLREINRDFPCVTSSQHLNTEALAKYRAKKECSCDIVLANLEIVLT